jgi:transposase
MIPIVGGLLIMMGQHDRSEALFYYFRLEDQVPETYLLRLVDKHISFAFVREKLKESYSDTGRPSIDPELLLRILLIGYLYGITSERKLVEELRMHLAWRWFTGLGFDQEIPHHSTFSKNRHGRFQESKLFEQLFEQIVRQCVEVGLVQGQHLSVDGSFIERMRPRRAASRASNSGTLHRCIPRCVNICRKWNNKTQWKSRCMSRTRYRPPIPIPLTRPRAARRRGSVTTTTIWWITTVV